MNCRPQRSHQGSQRQRSCLTPSSNPTRLPHLLQRPAENSSVTSCPFALSTSTAHTGRSNLKKTRFTLQARHGVSWILAHRRDHKPYACLTVEKRRNTCLLSGHRQKKTPFCPRNVKERHSPTLQSLRQPTTASPAPFAQPRHVPHFTFGCMIFALCSPVKQKTPQTSPSPHLRSWPLPPPP